MLGLVLGRDTLHTVIHQWGSPDSVFLAGHDSESGRSVPGDDLIARYERKIPVFWMKNTIVYFSIRAVDQRLRAVSVSFAGETSFSTLTIPTAEITRHLGGSFRTVHVELVCDSEGIECELGKCDSPRGKQELLINDEQAVMLIMDTNDHAKVVTMEFSEDIAARKTPYEACR